MHIGVPRDENEKKKADQAMIRLWMITILIRAILGVLMLSRAFGTIADSREKHR